ncbi:hypothetical protein SPHV1_2280127 [Novosphingobium sp. KN65.2]|nr:hypothetical protein SPHV1_2280127 [Novosphingobium sp. KN65.2]
MSGGKECPIRPRSILNRSDREWQRGRYPGIRVPTRYAAVAFGSDVVLILPELGERRAIFNAAS